MSKRKTHICKPNRYEARIKILTQSPVTLYSFESRNCHGLEE